MDRRTLLRTTGAAVTAATIGALLPHRAGAAGSYFLHGVASGDPLPDGILLWTRITPTPDAVPGSGVGPEVSLRWEIALDREFRHGVQRGSVQAGPLRDHTVKVAVSGLQPDTTYWYRFRFAGRFSVVARTRTAPAANALPDRLQFGVVSCANFEGGYFSAYRHLANYVVHNDVNAVIHLGDYIYEYGKGEYGPGPKFHRVHEPVHAIYSLADYRMRHAQYKRDPDLMQLHALVPFVLTWDDHEIADNAWENGSLDTQPGHFTARKRAARQAYAEWMPVRDLRDTPLYRSLRFGSLVDLSLLDLRSYRSESPTHHEFVHGIAGPDHTITGRPQMEWLKQQLESDAVWKVVGNPVMMAPLLTPKLPHALRSVLTGLSSSTTPPMDGKPLNLDQWDGYPRDREELLTHLQERRISNVAFLTGDIHTSWAADIPIDVRDYRTYRNRRPVAVEFVCPAITSDSMSDLIGNCDFTRLAKKAILERNAHIQYADLEHHGFSVLNVTRDQMSCSWHFIKDRTKPFTTLRPGSTVATFQRDTPGLFLSDREDVTVA